MQPSSLNNDGKRAQIRKSQVGQPRAATFSPSTAQTSVLTAAAVQRAAQDSSRLLPHEVMAWQRSAGNRAVAGLLGRDATAQTPAIQRMPVGPEGGLLQGDVEGRLRRAQGSGSALPDGVRSTLESKLGADLGGVKVHTGPQAVQLTREMGAKAFTHKNHIYYGAGHSPNDLKLTAHETVHTIQQGAVKQQAQRKQEDAISRAAKPQIARAPAQIQRLGFLDRLRHRRLNMSDEDVVNQTAGDGGSLNRVDKMKYNRRIGKSKSKTGFFKPNEVFDKGESYEYEDVDMAKRAVGSSLLDKWLGTNVLAEEVFAKHNNEVGSVSATVPGSPLQEVIFNTPVDPNTFDPDDADPTKYKQINGQWFEMSGVRQKYHDYSNPRTQKGLADLQLLDAITGQLDRHGGNIFYDDSTGNIKGIDNDQAFKQGVDDIDSVTDRYHGLPNLVDKRTAKRLLKRKAKNLPKLLGPHMAPQDVQNAQDRMRALKSHVKQLKKEKKLVKKWDDTTYLKALNTPDKTDKWKKPQPGNMLKRIVMNYVGATDREVPEQNNIFNWEDNNAFAMEQSEEEMEEN